jgi:hypothetical protein
LAAAITTGLILLTACENDAIDPLSGKYPEPATYPLSAVLSQNVVKGATIRTFTLELGTGSQYLSIEFTGNRLNYFLAPGNYTIANRSDAKAGNYIAGDADGGTWWVTSGTKLRLTDGTIFVELDGEAYTIRGVVMLEDRSIIRLAYTGVIVFEADPPSFTYTLDVTRPYAYTTDGTTFIPVGGSQLNRITVLSEGIEIAVLDVVTEENPASLAGNYSVKAVSELERAVVQGVYMDISSWFGVPGIPPTESPSYYLDGETRMFIREGDITITDTNGTLGITSSNLGNQDVSTQFGFGLLPSRGSINYVEATHASSGTSLPNLLAASAVDLSMFGLTGYTVTLKLGEAGVTAEPGGFGVTLGGDGQYISIDFSRDGPTLPAGTYNITDNTTAAVNDAIAGYPSLMGAGYMGSFWGTASGGVLAETPILPGGTVEVSESGGTYTITVNATLEGGKTVKAVYSGLLVIQ